MLVRMQRKGNFTHCWWEYKLVQPLWKTVWWFLKKWRTIIGPSNSTPGYISEKNPLIQKDTCTAMFIAALFTVANISKQPKCPSADEWVKNMWYIYNGILLSHKKERNFAICSNMDGLGGHYAKWNKSDRERQILYDITYMWI